MEILLVGLFLQKNISRFLVDSYDRTFFDAFSDFGEENKKVLKIEFYRPCIFLAYARLTGDQAKRTPKSCHQTFLK